MSEHNPSSAEILEGIDLEPRHESWARLSTQSTFMGFLIALAVIGSFIVVITTRFNPIAMAALVVMIAALIVTMIVRGIARRPRSVPNNLVLTARIRSDLHTELSVTNIQVESDRGVVTLRGVVSSANFREAVEQIARRAGARQVIDELKVVEKPARVQDDYLKSFPGVSTSEGAPEVLPFVTPEQEVRAALEADPRVNAHLIDIKFDLGMVTLTGRQETLQASQAATEIAVHVPGILGVSNEIEVMPSL